MKRINWNRWAGLAFMLGVLIFILNRWRHFVDPNDSFLWVFIVVGFILWIVGLVEFRARYRPRAGRLGRSGIMLMMVGIGFLAAGHGGIILTTFFADTMLGEDIAVGATFGTISTGTIILALGALLFGIAAVREHILPRWKYAPLVTGVIGLSWMLFASDSRPDVGNPEAFLVFRTLFGIGWLVVAYILWTDRADREFVPIRSESGQPTWRP